MFGKKKIIQQYEEEIELYKQRSKFAEKYDSLLQENSQNAYFITQNHDGMITNDKLRSILQIRGQEATNVSEFTSMEIYNALAQAKIYLNIPIEAIDSQNPDGEKRTYSEMPLSLYRPISPRQMFSSNHTIELILAGNYNAALHEFSDCIYDYGCENGKIISINEYTLYNNIISCFMAVINPETADKKQVM